MKEPAFIYKIVDIKTGAFSRIVATSKEKALEQFCDALKHGTRLKAVKIGPAPEYKQPTGHRGGGYADFD